MLTIAIALLAASPERSAANLVATTIQQQSAYKACLAEQTVAIGTGNSETAETVLRAVGAACLPVETKLRALYSETLIGSTHTERLILRDRLLGENEGVARLLAIRKVRPQSVR